MLNQNWCKHWQNSVAHYPILFIYFLLISGCQSEEEITTLIQDSNTFMTAKVNGYLTEFDYDVFAQKNEKYSITVTGTTKEDLQKTQSFQFVIFNKSSSIKAQTYDLQGENTQILVTYNIVKTISDASRDEQNFVATTSPSDTLSMFVINITDLDDQYVKGTFSGEIAKDIGNDKISTIKITEGVFSAPFK